ncbi:hypothetical protein [Pseudoalteromonas umbrosa]|uniref:hypothetical protein n=1 Tax=Pseudoalteromonas umbrosa TaxID=3048489 RepID=UPI0024C2F519|nr:hypothetical protein [Pseudoalteromonas sp. B95]MDK1287606.1 hypothetical protein [Pseudoalteromonas sp. B95]
MATRIIILISAFSLFMGCSSSYQVEEMSVGIGAEKGPILIYEFIKEMKPFIDRRTGQYKDRKLPYLIVGIKRIKVWISNAPADVLGRQILEIGSGMAQIKELPPENER